MKRDEEKLFEALCRAAIESGADKASVITTDLIVTDRAFRGMCEANRCGVYGKCWMCPPDVGDIDELMKSVRDYRFALVYQTISDLEDSYDFEGMIAAKKRSYPLAQALRRLFDGNGFSRVLHLGAGGCGVCEKCAKRTDEPCRFPDLAMPSLEAYGINVSKLAESAGMKYVNGANTVTYFGAVLFTLSEKEQL